MIEIQIPEDRDKIKRQIEALEYQIPRDKTEKDREIHLNALKDLKTALNSNVIYSELEETIKTEYRLDGEEIKYCSIKKSSK